MGAVPRSMERQLYNGLKKLFFNLINDIRNGYIGQKELPQKAREFLKSDEVNKYLNDLVGRMTRDVRKLSYNDFKKQISKSQNNRDLYRLITNEMKGPVGAKVNEIIADNVQYIKTVPQEWAVFITQYTQRESLKGRRPEDIEKDLRKMMPSHITKNLKCIARTECAKSHAALVQARAQACGIRCYIWRTVKDERVRPSHAKMEGTLVFYNDPPSPEALHPESHWSDKKQDMVSTKPYGNYHAGNTFNCRCWQQVVVDNRFIPDNVNVYSNESTAKMSRSAFLKMFGGAVD